MSLVRDEIIGERYVLGLEVYWHDEVDGWMGDVGRGTGSCLEVRGLGDA
jgi:hypothetical protein